jgi:hypothetical protein
VEAGSRQSVYLRWRSANDNRATPSHIRHEATFRLSVRQLVRSSACLLLLVAANRTGAQSTNPLLPDATVLPPRGARIRASASFTRADELLGAGGLRNLAAPLAIDSLGIVALPLLAPAETAIRAASGLPNFRLTAGNVVATGNSRAVVAPLTVEYGLTRRLTIGVVVPLVETRTTLSYQLNPTLGRANVGPNPVFGSNASTIMSQNNAVVTSLRAAADSLRGRVTSCAATPSDPVCGPLAGQSAAIQTLLQTTGNFATAIERLYGTGAANPGLPLIPLAGDASQLAIESQFTALQKSYQTFLTKNVVTSSVVPAAGPAANFQLQSLVSTFGRDTLGPVDRSSIGDILVGATFQIANTFPDSMVRGDRRRHVRLAGNASFRIGTGEPGSRNRMFDYGTGYGQPGILVGLAGDAQLTPRFSASAVANYTLQVGTIDVTRVPNANGSAFPLGIGIPGTFSAGNVLEVTAIPRYRLAGHFMINGQYSLLRTAADAYALGSIPTGALPPTSPSGNASATAHQVGLGFSYSTVGGPEARPGTLPYEMSFTHLETIAGSGGPLRKTFRDAIELRVYIVH